MVLQVKGGGTSSQKTARLVRGGSLEDHQSSMPSVGSALGVTRSGPVVVSVTATKKVLRYSLPSTRTKN